MSRHAFNGINAATGEPLQSPLSDEELAELAAGDPLDGDVELELRAKAQAGDEAFAPVVGYDATQLAEVGWGLVMPAATEPRLRARNEAIRNALAPLLELRARQAGAQFRPLLEVQSGDTRRAYLGRLEQPVGPIDPRFAPYYQLIAASPEDIPFAFQYSLDVPAAVGRLAFERVEDYERYARAVVAAESGPARMRARSVELLGTAHPGDRATEESSARLVEPLAADLARTVETLPALAGWSVNRVAPEEVTRAALLARLGGGSTPALLFVACHGLGLPKGDPEQRARQGALLCQGWPGQGAPTPDQVVTAADIADDADVAGLVCFLYACYGAGTPRADEFPHLRKVRAAEISDVAFVSRLAERLLAHPNGPALAVIGHVERAWTSSFRWDGTPQLSHFQAALRAVMRGYPIGWALEDFGQRHANLAVDLTDDLRAPSGSVAPAKISRQWTAVNDARGYVLLGDPAARLAC